MYEEELAGKIKAHEERLGFSEQAKQNMADRNMAGCVTSEPARPNLRERIASDLRRAGRERLKYERLAELQHLLEKHPDVARILDLLEETR